MSHFKDHFSRQSKGYGEFRPDYPNDLYQHLSDLCTGYDLAWDCATGTGQAARGLSNFFTHIIATDASEKQILNASGPANITFRVAEAQRSGLETSSVDLVMVAQALHWFSHDDFFMEVKRVLKPDGILAAWTYHLLQIEPEIDKIIQKFDQDIVGQYWPKERQLVRERYSSITFPFNEISMSPYNMTSSWALDELVGYLRTWSSVVRYKADRGRDPLEEIIPDLRVLWGDVAVQKSVQWPLTIRAGRF